METCHYCDHKNPEGFKYCNECGKKRYTPPIDYSKHFPQELEIHPSADIAGLIEKFWPFVGFIPSMNEFRAMLDKLTVNQRQVFIRVHRLDQPGSQPDRQWEEIAQEKQSSRAAIADAYSRARQNLRKELMRVQRDRACYS